MTPFRATLLTTPLALLVAACSGPHGASPSLAKRPYEVDVRPTDASPPGSAVASPAIPLTADIVAAIDAALARHVAAQADFSSARTTASARVSAGGGSVSGSEAWVAAALAIAAADGARAGSVAAMADLDRLYVVQIEREAGNAQLIGSDRIGSARDQVSADVDAQNAILDGLMAGLR